jgi:hypothetical protein
MTPEEKEQAEKTLILNYHKATEKLLSFPKEDMEAVQQMLLNRSGEFDARYYELQGEATKEQLALLKKRSREIKQFREIVDAWSNIMYYNMIFAAHQKGADLVEAAITIGEFLHSEATEEDAEKKLGGLLKRKNEIN